MLSIYIHTLYINICAVYIYIQYKYSNFCSVANGLQPHLSHNWLFKTEVLAHPPGWKSYPGLVVLAGQSWPTWCRKLGRNMQKIPWNQNQLAIFYSVLVLPVQINLEEPTSVTPLQLPKSWDCLTLSCCCSIVCLHPHHNPNPMIMRHPLSSHRKTTPWNPWPLLASRRRKKNILRIRQRPKKRNFPGPSTTGARPPNINKSTAQNGLSGRRSL